MQSENPGFMPSRTGGRNQLVGRLPKNGIGVEIGVWKGDFSVDLLREARPRALHLVDPWSFSGDFPQRWYGGAKARNQIDMDAIHRSVRARFANRPEVAVHRLRSADAARLFPDHHFDWAYVDGDHSYEAVLQDLTLWGAKIRPGGVLAGDDYKWRDEAGELSVARAITEFVRIACLPEPELLSGQFLFQL